MMRALILGGSLLSCAFLIPLARADGHFQKRDYDRDDRDSIA